MSNVERSRSGATTAQLKSDIDSGRTADKVAYGDPGLSPLGTDDEAAGTPASGRTVAATRERERDIGAAVHAAEANEPKGDRAWFIPTLITVLLVVVVGVGIFVLTR